MDNESLPRHKRNIVFNPFGSVHNYSEMLNKIAFIDFFAAIVVVAFLRYQLPYIDHFLDNVNTKAVIAELKIPLGTVGVAFLFAILSRAFKFHDRLSDILKIRERFDVEEILRPIASAVGLDLSGEITFLRQRRHPLMRKIFYRYASSDPERGVIEHHYVVTALDAWSWYWIVLEILCLVLVGAVTLALGGNFGVALLALMVALFFAVLLVPLRKLCAHAARDEVEEIVDHPGISVQEIKEEIEKELREFRAL